jgi:FKBP-type peptidyl-prolyl cis-trans isomerase (trigger factor)
MRALMEQHTTPKHAVEIKKLPNSRIEIKTSVHSAEFDKTRSEALRHIGAEVELPGFRKGHVPEKVLLARVGEGALLEEMAEIAISKAYPQIIVAEKLDVLGRPEISITKIAHGNALEFTITTAVFPEYTLPDYKKLARKAGGATDAVVVTDEDVASTLDQIRRMRKEQAAQALGEEVDTEAPLPELDDAFVATLGEFKTVEELKVKLRENILLEKTRAAKDKRRVAIMEAIVKETKMELPEVIVAQELARMQDEFGADIARMGMDFEKYLSTVQKTKEELHAEWRPDAQKRATIQILVGKIADEEKLEPEESLLVRDTKALHARYPETDEARVRSYVHMLLTNEKVFEFLESQAAAEA